MEWNVEIMLAALAILVLATGGVVAIHVVVKHRRISSELVKLRNKNLDAESRLASAQWLASTLPVRRREKWLNGHLISIPAADNALMMAFEEILGDQAEIRELRAFVADWMTSFNKELKRADVCPSCHGSGEQVEPVVFTDGDHHASETVTCRVCGGSGTCGLVAFTERPASALTSNR